MHDMAERKRLPDRRGELGTNARLKEPQVLEIRRRAAAGETHESLGKEFLVAKVTISFIVQRRLWKHVA
jgi:hypothetical protein